MAVPSPPNVEPAGIAPAPGPSDCASPVETPGHPDSASDAKAVLRRRLRAARQAFVGGLSPEQRAAAEMALADRLAPLLARASVVGGYCATGDEIDLALAMTTALGLGKTIAYPAIGRDGEPMLFRSGKCTDRSPWGGLQPAPSAAVVEPDLLLVPLLAVDRMGNRLGQGGGHYDRALPLLKGGGAVLVGVGWSVQRIDFDLVADPWDVPMDGFAWPDGVEIFRT